MPTSNLVEIVIVGGKICDTFATLVGRADQQLIWRKNQLKTPLTHQNIMPYKDIQEWHI